MHSRKTFLAGLLGSLVVLGAGCDSEPVDDHGGASETAVDDEDEVTNDDDGGSPPHADPPDQLRTPGPVNEPHCGDGIVDADEDCDDGIDNGPDRECTRFCTLNDCDLDEEGDCLAAP
jgi:hypothetical protein